MEHPVGFSLPFGFPGFIGLWCLVCFLFSLISGWKSLATQFQTQNKPAGRHFSMQSASLGVVHYKGAINIGATPEGLYMSVMVFFRLGHPPLLVPWSEVGPITYSKTRWRETWTIPIVVPGARSVELIVTNENLVEEIENYIG